MDRKKLITEILELVDSDSLNYIDIFTIIEKNSVGLDLNEQTILRASIVGVLKDLRDNGDIDFNDGSFNITASTAQVFLNSSGLIKSTLKRKEKLEQIERDKSKSQLTYQATFTAPFTGNFNQGKSDGLRQSNNDESDESKELTKKTLEDLPKNKWYRKWQFILALAVIALMLLTLLLSTCNKS